LPVGGVDQAEHAGFLVMEGRGGTHPPALLCTGPPS
jgi:hypothetical protein